MARHRAHIMEALAAGLAMLALCALAACGGSGSGGETISGAAFEAAPAVHTVTFNDSGATTGPLVRHRHLARQPRLRCRQGHELHAPQAAGHLG